MSTPADRTNLRTEQPTQEARPAPDAAQLAHDVLACFREYAGQRPEVVALWSFGLGFVLGWKLKPW